MLAHRRQLLEDYKLSPDLVVACRAELEQFCHSGQGGGGEGGGRTLHCLMKHARSHKMKRRVSDDCRFEVSVWEGVGEGKGYVERVGDVYEGAVEWRWEVSACKWMSRQEG